MVARKRVRNRHGILMDLRATDSNEKNIAGCLFCQGIELRGLRVEKPGHWVVDIDQALMRISLLSLLSPRLRHKVDSFMAFLGGHPAISSSPDKRIFSLPFLHADGVKMILYHKGGPRKTRKKKKNAKRILRIDMLGISNMVLRVVKESDDRVATYRVQSLCSFRPLKMTPDAVVFDILFRAASEGRIEEVQNWSREFSGEELVEDDGLSSENDPASRNSNSMQVVANLAEIVLELADPFSFSPKKDPVSDHSFVFSKRQHPEKQLITHSFKASFPIDSLSLWFRAPYDSLANTLISHVSAEFGVEEDEIRQQMTLSWKVTLFERDIPVLSELEDRPGEWTFEGSIEDVDVSRAKNRREVLELMKQVLIEEQQKELVRFAQTIPEEIVTDALRFVASLFDNA